MRSCVIATALLITTAIFAEKANSAPVFVQDYEAPGNLDDPFNLSPPFSGTTDGVLGSSPIAHVPADGANGTFSSAEISILYDPLTSPGAGGWAWQVRLLPNSGGSSNAQNPLFNADGYVGYWLKVDASVSANMFTAPVLEPATGTMQATVGSLKPIIRDGQWRLYEWNMDDLTQFTQAFSNVFGTTATGFFGDNVLDPTNSYDSIAIVSATAVNATLRIDQIGYNPDGPFPIVPEPAAVAITAIGLLGVVSSLRRNSFNHLPSSTRNC